MIQIEFTNISSCWGIKGELERLYWKTREKEKPECTIRIDLKVLHFNHFESGSQNDAVVIEINFESREIHNFTAKNRKQNLKKWPHHQPLQFQLAYN